METEMKLDKIEKSGSGVKFAHINLFIDIEKYYGKKLKSLEQFKSQSHKLYFKKESLDAFHSNFQCNKKGKGMVEQFKIIELFGV